LPDVVCDFSDVKVTQQAPDRVLVTGARGHPAPDTYKVCATYFDGFRGGLTMGFYGIDASRKAERFAEVVYKRARRTLRALNLPEFTQTSTEVLGAESQYGSARRVEVAREVVVKIAAKHPDAAGIGILLKEATGLGLSAPPGLSGFAGGRPKPTPVARLFCFAIRKEKISITIEIDGRKSAFADAIGRRFDPSSLARPDVPQVAEVCALLTVPLVALAWARSGDKGDKANIGVIARRAEYFPYICRSLTAEVVAERFGHFLQGGVERFILPGPHALNFLLHDVLGGGGIASIRNDPQGKGYSQLLLEVPIEVPAALAKRDQLPTC
jgi:hypothetical protein